SNLSVSDSLSGYAPFHESFSENSVKEQIIRGEFTMVPSKWRRVSNQAKDVVRKLLVVDPTQRMSVDEALQHPWLQVGELQMHHQSHVLSRKPERSPSWFSTTMYRLKESVHQ
ncbi:hypothetical protein GOODEAATRI_028432, partial [Goodea atripinnis]